MSDRVMDDADPGNGAVVTADGGLIAIRGAPPPGPILVGSNGNII